MVKFQRRKNINIGRVVFKVFGTVLALYVGGTVMTQLGSVMNGTCSPFYSGLQLIGWTVQAPTNATLYGCATTNANTIISTSGAGVLSVIGIIGLGLVVMEFVNISW